LCKGFLRGIGTKINADKTKVLKKGGKLSRDEKWWLDGDK
jgi:hypothetical protein